MQQAVLSPGALTDDDRAALRAAYHALEHPSFAARLANALGAPLEQGLRLLPRRWHDQVHTLAAAALRRALGVAIGSLGTAPQSGSLGTVLPRGGHDGLHKALAMASGAAGGFFGLSALAIELPVTTVIMLRAIADVAHAEGEDLRAVETRLACLEVFAYGGPAASASYAEIGYYEVRAALALHLRPLAGKLAENGAGIPGAVEFIRGIAGRFGAVVSDKAAAQMVPVVGAAAGALINAVFMQHFQSLAQGHFTLRRLERRYGAEAVAAAYREVAACEAALAAHRLYPLPAEAQPA